MSKVGRKIETVPGFGHEFLVTSEGSPDALRELDHFFGPGGVTQCVSMGQVRPWGGG